MRARPDVVTVYEEGAEIGTLVLELKSTIRAGAYSGNIMGYGTGACARAFEREILFTKR